MRLRIPTGPIKAFERPRPRKDGRGYYSPHKPFQDDVAGLIRNAMRVQGDHLIEGPVSVHLFISRESMVLEVLPIIGTHPSRPTGVRFDIDNILKLVVDAAQKEAYVNDRQIVEVSARFIQEGTA